MNSTDSTLGQPRLDHLVLAVPDLSLAVARFAERTGITPTPGGSHVGVGTANHLVGLGPGRYLEIIGPDPRQDDPEQPRPFGIDDLTEPRLITWAVATDDIEALIAQARDGGYDPGSALEMSRRTPDGELLSWRLTQPRFDYGDGVVPFLIDWGDTPHPTSRNLATAELVSLHATHPDPASVRPALAALRVDLHLDIGARPALAAAIRTANGAKVIDL